MESKHIAIANDEEYKKKQQNIVQLQKMQQAIAYHVHDKNEPSSVLEKIPFLTRFMRGSSDIANHSIQINSTLRGVSTPSAIGSGFQFGAVGLAALDFLLIPAIYISAFILNRKVPFTVTNNMKWGYSAIALGLSLTAALVPAAAPIIGVVAAALAVVVSAALLGKALYDRYQLGRERRGIRNDISDAEEEMQRIQTNAKSLEKAVKDATNKDFLIELYKQTALVQKEYEAQKNKIQELKEKEGVLNKKIKELGILPMLDKGLAVSFAALGVIGAVVSLFFPPVGLGILMGVTIASFSYFIGRLTIPLIINAAKSLINKLWPASPTAELGQEKEPLLTPQHEPQVEQEQHFQQSHDNSTVSILYQLVGDKDAIKSHQRSVALNNTILSEPEVINESTSDVEESLKGDNSIDAPIQTHQ